MGQWFGRVAQSVEHRTFNARVAGSIPAALTNFILTQTYISRDLSADDRTEILSGVVLEDHPLSNSQLSEPNIRRTDLSQKFSIIHMFMVCFLSMIATKRPSGDGKPEHAWPRHFRKDATRPRRSTCSSSVPPCTFLVTKNPF